MMRTKSLWAVLGCVAVLGLVAGCSDDDSAVCGNGIVEGNEDCDLLNLDGMTCEDVTGEPGGTLQCGAQCVFDISLCGGCGNGIEEFGEECDCGADPQNLPAGCTAVNGGTNANCTANCEEIDLCGDGVRTGDEECDCGDPSMVTAVGAGCTEYNGAMNGSCSDTCTEIYQCEFEAGEECDILQGDAPTHGCCEDEYGVQLECVTSLYSGMENMCNRACTTNGECGWNEYCLGTQNPQYPECYNAMCSPDDPFIPADFNGACQAPAGGTEPGVCIQFGRYVDTHDFYGICIEQGEIAHGDPCPTRNANPPVYLIGTDRDIAGGAAASMCDTGICLATTGATEGQCANFCDWEGEYDSIFYGAAAPTLTCPASSNCWAEATISQDDVSQYADFGYRGGDLAYCRPLEADDPTYGLTTCSLVTGQLLSNPSQTCANAFTDGRCLYVTYSVDYYDANGNVIATGSEPTLGSLIGVCGDSVPTTAGLNVWDDCDAANDVCPIGSNCMEQDIFGAATGQTKCIPYCDTAHHDGTTASCVDLGTPATTADGTPTCTSVSYTFGAGGAADPSKSRLGYCALPMP